MGDSTLSLKKNNNNKSFRKFFIRRIFRENMASMTRLVSTIKSQATVQNTRCLSTTLTNACSRFGTDKGESGWKWEKGGIGMGGKDAGKATEIKDTVGKDKEYKAPEFFGYDNYSFYDIEKECVDKRCPQPKSGLSEYW